MADILSGCQVALTHGRYRWRLDKVPRELADMLEVERRRKRQTDQKPGQIQFVRQGEASADKRAPRQKAVLDRGHKWMLLVVLDRKLVFPNIRETNPRPDAVLAVKDVGRENCEEAH